MQYYTSGTRDVPDIHASCALRHRIINVNGKYTEFPECQEIKHMRKQWIPLSSAHKEPGYEAGGGGGGGGGAPPPPLKEILLRLTHTCIYKLTCITSLI